MLLAFSQILCTAGYKRPILMQSMYIFKQPGIGGEVVPHQDNSFLYTDPPSCVGLWLALEDANVVLPASHKGGLARRFLRDENGVKFDKEPAVYDMSRFVPVEVKAGSLVVLHGNLVHQSFRTSRTSPAMLTPSMLLKAKVASGRTRTGKREPRVALDVGSNKTNSS